MLLNREFNKVESLALITKSGFTAANQKVFITPAPFLTSKRIDAISYSTTIGEVFVREIFLTLVNSKKEIVLFNYPMHDLWDGRDNFNNTIAFTPFLLRLFKIDGLITENSYFTFSTGRFNATNFDYGRLILYSKN